MEDTGAMVARIMLFLAAAAAAEVVVVVLAAATWETIGLLHSTLSSGSIVVGANDTGVALTTPHSAFVTGFTTDAEQVLPTT